MGPSDPSGQWALSGLRDPSHPSDPRRRWGRLGPSPPSSQWAPSGRWGLDHLSRPGDPWGPQGRWDRPVPESPEGRSVQPGRSGLEWEGESADRVELAGRAEPDGRGSTRRAAAPAGH
ncbi:hypothetical protein K200098A10_46660 [Flavonifractor plautii]